MAYTANKLSLLSTFADRGDSLRRLFHLTSGEANIASVTSTYFSSAITSGELLTGDLVFVSATDGVKFVEIKSDGSFNAV